MPESAFRAIEAIVPTAKRRDIPGPHLLLQVNPQEAWQAITEFVATVCEMRPSLGVACVCDGILGGMAPHMNH